VGGVFRCSCLTQKQLFQVFFFSRRPRSRSWARRWPSLPKWSFDFPHPLVRYKCALGKGLQPRTPPSCFLPPSSVSRELMAEVVEDLTSPRSTGAAGPAPASLPPLAPKSPFSGKALGAPSPLASPRAQLKPLASPPLGASPAGAATGADANLQQQQPLPPVSGSGNESAGMGSKAEMATPGSSEDAIKQRYTNIAQVRSIRYARSSLAPPGPTQSLYAHTAHHDPSSFFPTVLSPLPPPPPPPPPDLTQNRLEQHRASVQQAPPQHSRVVEPSDRPASRGKPSASRKPARKSRTTSLLPRWLAGAIVGFGAQDWLDNDDQKLHEDPHGLTWEASLDEAKRLRDADVGDFATRAAALMQDHTIIAAFAKFDTEGTGEVPTERLTEVMNATGNQLDPSEMSSLIQKASPTPHAPANTTARPPPPLPCMHFPHLLVSPSFCFSHTPFATAATHIWWSSHPTPSPLLECACSQLDLNGDGNIDLWELCCFLISRHDEVMNAYDENYFVDQGLHQLMESDEDGNVTVAELRRIFTMVDQQALRGVGDAAFNLLLSELGVAGASNEATVPLDALLRHPAFADPPRPLR
jgi:hypothetical protein